MPKTPSPPEAAPAATDQAATTAPNEAASLASTVGRLAHAIHRLPPGQRAELRRGLGPAGFTTAGIFWELVTTHLEGDAWYACHGTGREVAWATLLAGLAECDGLHAPAAPLGSTLADSLSEARFLALLRARGEGLHHQVRQIAHHLAQRQIAVSWTDLAELVLSDELSSRDSVRHRLARSFYRTRSAQERAAD